MSSKNSCTPRVTALVYNAKGLKPKKKDKHKFCVIIGVGVNKFRTDVTEDLFDNPVFNTECDIDVDDITLPLTFVVTEKNDRDILGQVTVPLSDLTSFRTNRPVRRALQAHKKCPQPVGELTFEAWVSAGQLQHDVAMTTVTSRDVDDDDKVTSSSTLPAGLRKLKDRLTSQQSPILHRKLSDKGHKRNNSDGTVQLTTSDLSTTTTTSESRDSSSPRRRSVMTTTTTTADTESLSSVDYNKPEVTGVSPKEGSTEGGTRLTIRGSNLGRSKEDVVGLYVCGSNVLSSLEFQSSSKLVCVTKPHKACSGTVVVETQAGGRGVSLVQFTFTGDTSSSAPVSAAMSAAQPAVGGAETYSDSTSEYSTSSLSRSSSRGDADVKRDVTADVRRDVIKREASVKSDSGAGIMSTSIKSALKARSMFDLSLSQAVSSKSHAPPTQSTPPTRPDVLAPPTRPEVTGVSPREGAVHSETKLTIRGSNLGQSASDVVSVSVAGVDCTATLDYDSSTRLSCVAGPTASAPTVGDVIVETKSGGVGVSMVQFRFVDSSGEEDQFSAVPYDAGESRQTGSSLVRLSTADSPFQRVRQTPPVVEIQPMMSRSHGKGPAPPPPGSHSPPISPRSTSQLVPSEALHRSPGHDIWLNDRIAEMSSSLAATEELVKKLQHENKLLRDENDRMRQYMECLVSKAIATCPQILCVDTTKLF